MIKNKTKKETTKRIAPKAKLPRKKTARAFAQKVKNYFHKPTKTFSSLQKFDGNPR